jgi:predicted kinase
MKTLSLSKPLILILIGLPGSGKSFFAEKFSEMFTSPLVSHDRLRFELFTSPKFSPNEFEIITRLAEYQMAELVKTKRSFIVDGGGNTFAERQKLQRLAKANGYDTLLIWTQTDDLTCRKRALNRSPKGVDAQSPNLTEQQWVSQAKRFNPPTREHYMVISGKHAFSTQAKMVLRKLTTPHTEAAQTAHKEQTQVRQTANALPQRTVAPAERPVSPPRRSVVIS